MFLYDKMVIYDKHLSRRRASDQTLFCPTHSLKTTQVVGHICVVSVCANRQVDMDLLY